MISRFVLVLVADAVVDMSIIFVDMSVIFARVVFVVFVVVFRFVLLLVVDAVVDVMVVSLT